MDIPQPKYSMGQTVYFPGVSRKMEDMTCPDCGGSEKMTLKLVNREVEIKCMRCRSYSADKPKRTVWVPFVSELTVRSMEFRTHGGDNWSKPSWRYMTGTGGGSVFDEENTYPTREEAMHHAELKAKEAQAKFDAELPKEEQRRLEYTQLQFPELEEKKLRDVIFDTQWALDRMTDRVKELPSWSHRWPNVKASELLAIQQFVLDKEDWHPEDEE
jgi:hypothetical protein